VKLQKEYLGWGNTCRPRVLAMSSVSSCSGTVSMWDLSMTATGSESHKASDYMVGLGSFLGELQISKPSGFYPSSPPTSIDH
jgi:hypothetical protein